MKYSLNQTSRALTTIIPCWFVVVLLSLSGGNAAAKPSTADIMIVLDLSGSMKTAKNNHRFDSFFTWAAAFTSSEDRIGIVAMGNRARLIVPLTPKNDFSFPDLRRQLNHRSQYTDVAAGLENAYYELKNNSRKDADKLMLLFSDAQIDMPKGMWDLENSLRYLHNSLIPAMKREDIRLIGVVPDGLKANFQLLHEIANGTGGSYYRGIPGDAVAIRQKLAASQPILKNNAATPAAKNKKNAVNGAKKGVSKTASTTAPSAKNARPGDDKESTTIPAKTAESHSSDGIQPGIYVLGGILLLGFAVVFAAMVLLFKRTSASGVRDKSENNDELVDVLEELRSLKSETEKSDIMAKQYDTDMDDEAGPNFGEPADELSVSLVSPFLDYQEAQGTINVSPTDEIAIKPAFSADHPEDPSLSVSNMETLIGTGLPEIEEK